MRGQIVKGRAADRSMARLPGRREGRRNQPNCGIFTTWLGNHGARVKFDLQSKVYI